MIGFVQPFGLNSAGGGSRILRALLKDAPLSFISICTSPEKPPPSNLGPEIHLPKRPSFGRLEYTRLNPFLDRLNLILENHFERRLEKICIQNGVTSLHIIAHDIDFLYAFNVAKKLEIPFYLSIHDDFLFSLKGKSGLKKVIKKFPEIWELAQHCFVISSEMGQEYCHRYGNKSYSIVTDGIENIPEKPLLRKKDKYNIYFFGLFHLSYEPNLQCLLDALKIIQISNPLAEISVTCRCNYIRPEVLENRFPVRILPFAPEKEALSNFEVSDLLYLPLPFGNDYKAFNQFSLSTKLISYLGSGLPILYHGPINSAAGSLLSNNNAAIIIDTLNSQTFAEHLVDSNNKKQDIASNALALGRNKFSLSFQRNKFWSKFGNEIEL